MSTLTGMAPFWGRFLEIAKRETRVAILLWPQDGLPANEYAFTELYCADPVCDCRRALIQVRTEDKPNTILATINYGWETEEFYTQWMHGDRKAAREIRAAWLDPLNPQSDLAPALLRLFRAVALSDQAYVVRLGIHYAMFKQNLGKPPKSRTTDNQKRMPNA
jgi:hypothetical protein